MGLKAEAEAGKSGGGLFLCPRCSGLLGNSRCQLVVFHGSILVFVGSGAASLASPAADPHRPTGLPAFPDLPISQSHPGSHNAMSGLPSLWHILDLF